MNPSEPLPPVEPPPPTRVDIKRVLVKSEIELLKTVPRNPTVRAIVLARTGVAIPDEMTEYAQIQELIETTCKIKARVSERNGVPVLVKVSVPVQGRCRFEAKAVGEDHIYILSSTLREIVASMRSGDRWGHFKRCVIERLRSIAAYDVMLELTEFEYSEPEETHRDNDERHVEFDENDFESTLREFMRANWPGETRRLLANDGLEEGDSEND